MTQLFVREKSFYREAALLAVPVVLQNMITIGVNMLDTIMLGSFGEVQLSGSSLANSFISIYQILCMGIGSGAAVLTAQFWGAGNVSAIRKIYSLMLRICLSVSLLFTVLSLAFPAQVMRIFTPDQAVVEAGSRYLRIISPTFVLMGVSTTTTMVLRSVHEIKFPLATSLVSFACNLLLNWVFIFGRLGAPRMEIAGAALATVLARLVEALMVMGYLLFRDRRIGFRLRHLFESCADYLGSYLKYSVPVIVSDFLLGMGNTAVTIIIGHLGSSFVSANAIVALIVRLSTVMNQGIANAGSIMTGHTLGRGDREKTHSQGVTFLCLSVLMGMLASGVSLAFSPLLVGSYNITSETRDIAARLIDAVSIMVIFQATQSMLTKGILRGGGDTRFLMIADIAFMWICSIPLGYLAAFVWHLSPFWIYLLMKIDYFIKTVICAWRLRGTKWMRMLTRAPKAGQALEGGSR